MIRNSKEYARLLNNYLIIVIGGDHHNTLSVMRCLGMNRIRFCLIVHGDEPTKKRLNLSYSKYCKNIIAINENERTLVDVLKSLTKERKGIVIPCSDYSAYIIDRNYQILRKTLFMPGFKNKPGMVADLMDKFNQAEFASRNGILVAKSWSIKGIESLPQDIRYPCILKPEVSAVGHKTDIRICSNYSELRNYLSEMMNKGYTDILLQEYLTKRYEAVALGCICNSLNYNCETIIKKIREYGGGSTSFGIVDTNREVYKTHHKLMHLLWKNGYRGQYDIEYFVCDNGVYLNEINFRHSGCGSILIYNNVPAPIISALTLIDTELSCISYERKLPVNTPYMCDIQDVRFLKSKKIGLAEFFKEFTTTKARAYFNIYDLMGTWGFYKDVFRDVIGIRRS